MMAHNNSFDDFMQDPLWYKDAIIYQVHIKSFFDANDDGIGDFPGLIAKLDYIAHLGVNTLWLLPFFPSPRRDDGYDISNYRDVHPDYGTMSDAKRLIAEAHKRNLRVICELVINHTSDQHPWFQRARRAKRDSATRNYYVWSDDDQQYTGTRIIFVDTEKSNWTWDPVAGQYFWHRFYSHQPDLNFDNPQVLKEVLAIMRFWFDLGVDGLRLDAIPYLIEREGTNNENLPETHQVLKKMRAELDRLYTDKMFLAEANQWPEDTQPYFGGNEKGEGDECHMVFHFPLMPRMYMALAQEDRFPIADILRQTPDIPDNCQWAIFLRNHDELTLEMVTDKERDHLWSHYAVDQRARINVGIRRRLAPLVERDRRRIELLNSLLLSMPGTPTLYYGDELGMGDNIFLGDRDGVRTPMQWSIDRNGGFSRADPARMVLPPIQDPLYGFQTINVEAQMADPHSLLNWTRRMLDVRTRQRAFGRGTFRMLAPANRRILAYLREYTREDGSSDTILCVANVSRAAQAVELDLSAFAGKVPVEMTGGSAFPPIGVLSYLLTLPPYGFYWFYLAEQNRMPAWHVEPPEQLPDMTTLVIKRHLQDILLAPARRVLEEDVLPAYLAKRRWFSGEHAGPVRVRSAVVVGAEEQPFLLGELEVGTERDGVERYQLPWGYVSDDDSSLLPNQLAMARIRRGREVGLLSDGFVMDGFIRQILEYMRDGSHIAVDDEVLVFSGSPQVAALLQRGVVDISWLSAEQSNSSALIGDAMMLKLLRKICPGIHPELEMDAFLASKGFTHYAPVRGALQRLNRTGEPCTLMILQEYIDNQGDAWEWTQDSLQRALRDQLGGGISPQENQFGAMSELETFATHLGQRLGELHTILASDSDQEDFGTRATDASDTEKMAEDIAAQFTAALQVLEARRDALSERELSLFLAPLQTRRADIHALIAHLARLTRGALHFRIHGDLHLGQVLVVQGDAYFIDFEGEPARPLAERRARFNPYKDVAGILRSIDYAVAVARRDGVFGDEVSQPALSESVLNDYRERSRKLFLDAYWAATTNIAHDWQSPSGPVAALVLFAIEKACYEIGYEAAHRPDWISVPLQGLSELLEQAGEIL